MDTTLFIATKAFIRNKEGKVLIVRESGKYVDGTNEGLYDVPGGRLTPGENFRDALMREVKEETGLSVHIGDPIIVDEWRPEVNGKHWQIVGIFFACAVDGDETVTLGDDHDAYEWIDPKDATSFELLGNLSAAFKKYVG